MMGATALAQPASFKDETIVCWVVLLQRRNGTPFIALGEGSTPATFRTRKDAIAFRDELTAHRITNELATRSTAGVGGLSATATLSQSNTVVTARQRSRLYCRVFVVTR